jgi:hypothetical protein
VRQALQHQNHLWTGDLAADAWQVDDLGSERIGAEQETLDRVVEPALGQIELVPDSASGSVDLRLRHEEGIDVTRCPSIVIRERDRGAADDVQVGRQTVLLEIRPQRGERPKNLGAVHLRLGSTWSPR